MSTEKETLYNKLIIHPNTNERKNFAIWMMWGGAVIFTSFALATLIMLNGHPEYVFWYGILAHVHVFSILGGFVALLVRRRILVSKEGLTIEDSSGHIELEKE